MSRILFDELWINLADITYSHLYLCRNWKIEGIFQRKNSSNKFLENYKNLQQFILSLLILKLLINFKKFWLIRTNKKN